MPALGKIRKDRGDRWYIELPGRVRIYCDKQHRSFYSRKHCEWTLNQIHGELENGTFDQDFYSKKKKSLHSFSVYATTWLSHCERRVERSELSPTYLGSLRNYVNNMFIPFFGDTNILDIRGRHIKEFYMKLDYSPKSLWNIMSALHKLFGDAKNEEVIQAIPNFPMEFKASSLPEPNWQWASVEVQDAIFAHLSPEAFYNIFFLATHGCRPGEGRALQHQDIDLENGTVTIRRAFADNTLRPFTKSKRIRVLPIDPEWQKLYQAQPRQLNRNAFVFADSEGKPHGRNWARNQWNAAVEAAGIAPISLYSGTRHSLASQAVNNGASIYAVSKFLGHSNLEQTKRYSHLEVNPLRQVQRKAEVKPLGCKVSARGGKTTTRH